MHTDPSPISSSSSPSSSSTPKFQSKKRKRSIRNPNPPPSPWRSPKQQQLYSSNLLSALRHLRRSPPTSLAVHAAADRALAATAHGRSRWSRAILSNRSILLKIRRPKVARPKRSNRSKAARSSEMESRVRVLGRMVPGCKKLGLDSLLDEASDYIAALEVQVRAMNMIAGVLAAASSSESPALRS